MLTSESLAKIIPFAGRRVGLFLIPLSEAMDEFGIDTPLRQAAFIAQVAHESGSLRYVEEIASGMFIVAFTKKEEVDAYLKNYPYAGPAIPVYTEADLRKAYIQGSNDCFDAMKKAQA